MEDDPEQGLGSLILGAGSDWGDTGPSCPISDEEWAKISKAAEDMARRAGESLDKLIVEAWKSS